MYQIRSVATNDAMWPLRMLLDLFFVEVVTGNRGIFQSINVQKKTMTVKEYEEHTKNEG